MDIKVGDTVRLKPMTVKRVNEYNDVLATITDEDMEGDWFPVSAIESVIPIALQPGDKALWTSGQVGANPEPVEIIALRGTDAWVERGGHPPKRLTIPLASLTRMP